MSEIPPVPLFPELCQNREIFKAYKHKEYRTDGTRLGKDEDCYNCELWGLKRLRFVLETIHLRKYLAKLEREGDISAKQRAALERIREESLEYGYPEDRRVKIEGEIKRIRNGLGLGDKIPKHNEDWVDKVWLPETLALIEAVPLPEKPKKSEKTRA